jgi:hypothetical protein
MISRLQKDDTADVAGGRVTYHCQISFNYTAHKWCSHVVIWIRPIYYRYQHYYKFLRKKNTNTSYSHQLVFVVSASIWIFENVTGPKSHVLVPFTSIWNTTFW